ncbi:MAG: DUF4190 domain-containing protein [Actinobacteria bacterium]|nr:DUF4190 domain-containing protein [Actinomycetota bacterium]MBM3712269.1 DUF4190 domain-containing protein [Actinomycetota bacterium]
MEEEQKTEEVQPQVIGAPSPEERASGLAITAMVLGIVALVCSWVMGLNFALGIAALVIGIIEFKKIKEIKSSEKGKGMALTGIILGAIGILGGIIYVIVIAVTAASFFTWLPSLMESLNFYY